MVKTRERSHSRVPILIALNLVGVALLCTSCVQRLFIPPALQVPRQVQSGELPLKLSWQTRLDEIVIREPVLVGDHLLLITTGHLVRLDTRTGAVAWRAPLPGGAYSIFLPIEHDGVIYLGGENDKGLVALDATTGEELWSRPLEEGIFRPTTAGVAYAAGLVFAASATTSTVFAYDARDGSLRWSAEVDSLLRGAPLQVVDDRLFVFTDPVYQFDITTGKLVDTVRADIATLGAQYTTDRLYGSEQIFDTRTLQPVTALQTPHDLDPEQHCTAYPQPYTLTQAALYAAGNCGVYRLSLQGLIQWAYTRTPRPNTPVGVYGGHVYVLLGDGAIVALNEADGKQVARLKTTPPLLGYTMGDQPSRSIVGTPCGVVAMFNSYDVWGFIDPTATNCQ